jgi:hypothetical protein
MANGTILSKSIYGGQGPFPADIIRLPFKEVLTMKNSHMFIIIPLVRRSPRRQGNRQSETVLPQVMSKTIYPAIFLSCRHAGNQNMMISHHIDVTSLLSSDKSLAPVCTSGKVRFETDEPYGFDEFMAEGGVTPTSSDEGAGVILAGEAVTIPKRMTALDTEGYTYPGTLFFMMVPAVAINPIETQPCQRHFKREFKPSTCEDNRF